MRTVRVNDWTTQWTYKDVIEVVEGAGANLDCIMLPKVQTADQVIALDVLLTQIETTMGYEVGRIGIEAQIENALGLINVDAIATASPRVETIIFGPADFMASINMKSLVVGEQPPGYDVGDAYHYILMRLLMAARAHDKQVIDGPYLQIKDLDGFRRVAGRSAALGFDGKWTLHPAQIEAANEVFSPLQEDYDHAENILDAYELLHLRAGRRHGRGHARRRDDRRGLAQDGAGDLGQGPRRRSPARRRLVAAGGLSLPYDPHVLTPDDPPTSVSGVRVDDEGITARSADEVVLDVLFDGRRIWSFWLHRDGSRLGQHVRRAAGRPRCAGSWTARTRLQLVEHVVRRGRLRRGGPSRRRVRADRGGQRPRAAPGHRQVPAARADLRHPQRRARRAAAGLDRGGAGRAAARPASRRSPPTARCSARCAAAG